MGSIIFIDLGNVQDLLGSLQNEIFLWNGKKKKFSSLNFTGVISSAAFSKHVNRDINEKLIWCHKHKHSPHTQCFQWKNSTVGSARMRRKYTHCKKDLEKILQFQTPFFPANRLSFSAVKYTADHRNGHLFVNFVTSVLRVKIPPCTCSPWVEWADC